MCANSEGYGENMRMRMLAWVFAGRLCDKYHNLMSRLILLIQWALSCRTVEAFYTLKTALLFQNHFD